MIKYNLKKMIEGMIGGYGFVGEQDEELDPRQKKRLQGKNFKGYKNTMPYTNRKFYPNMSDEEWKAKQGDNVDEDRRDPNITRGPKGLGKYTLDYDKKKKTFDSQGNPREGGFIVPARKRKGDAVTEDMDKTSDFSQRAVKRKTTKMKKVKYNFKKIAESMWIESNGKVPHD